MDTLYNLGRRAKVDSCRIDAFWHHTSCSDSQLADIGIELRLVQPRGPNASATTAIARLALSSFYDNSCSSDDMPGVRGQG